MSNRTIIILAIVLGIIAILLGLAYFFITVAPPKKKTYKVLKAVVNLPAGAKITAEKVKIEEQDKPPPPGVFDNLKPVLGKYTNKSISGNSYIKVEDITEGKQIVIAAYDLAESKKIEVNDLSLMEVGIIPPGAIRDKQAIVGKYAAMPIKQGDIIKPEQLISQLTNVVYAAKKIPARTVIKSDMVYIKGEVSAPPGSYNDILKVVGKVSIREIKPNEVISSSDIFQGNIKLSFLIPSYKRAITIPISDYNSLSSLIRPGDIVDVYVFLPKTFQSYAKQELKEKTTYTYDKSGNITGGEKQFIPQTVSDYIGYDVLMPIATSAMVLSLDQNFSDMPIQSKQGGQFNFQKVTLAVTHREAEKINYVLGVVAPPSIDASVKFFIVLRPFGPSVKYPLALRTIFDVLNEPVKLRGLVYKPMEMIYGSDRTTIRVPAR